MNIRATKLQITLTMKRKFAAQKTELSGTRSRPSDFNPTGHKEHLQRRRQDPQLNWLFLGLILFSLLQCIYRSNSSHFCTARAGTSLLGDSRSRTTSVSTVFQQATGSLIAPRERPLKVNDKYKGCS